MENKPYAIRNKSLANALHWLSSQRFTITNDKDNPNINVYTFERTEKLMQIMTELNHLKLKYKG